MDSMSFFLSKRPQIKRLLINMSYKLYKAHSFFYPNLREKILSYPLKVSFPRIVHPENINICNSKCVMCPYPLMTRKKGLMSNKLYKKIVDECVQHNEFRELWLYMFGEPLLDKDIFKKIMYAKRKGVPIVFLSTNASVLDENKAKKMIESGLDSIVVSLDGTKKTTYERLRQGLNFDEVTTNIKTLISLKKKMGKNTPKVTLQIIKMNDTKAEIKSFIKKWENLADTISVVPCHDYAGQRKGKANWVASTEKRLPCDYLWDKCTILHDGRVVFCCMDYDGRIIVGDINKESIEKVWDGNKMQSLRKLHIEGKFNKIPLCSECNIYLNLDKDNIAKSYIDYLKQ